LPYLDGLRAIAALYVVMFHAVLGFSASGLKGPWKLLKAATTFGHEAVAVFIVLSGYCLMLLVASDTALRLGGFGKYIGRRAYRILPPYFAAFALSLSVIAALPSLQRSGSGTIWDDSLPALSWEPIAAHLLLVHNWIPTLAFRINGPLWSVATEWQIYFLFPALLLPALRRTGMLATCALAIALGFLPLAFAERAAHAAIPWYLALFAFGMCAAMINVSNDSLAEKLRAGVPWRWLALAAWLGCFGFGLGAARIWFRYKALTDLLVGAATATLLVHLTESARQDGQDGSPRRHPLLRLLEAMPLQRIGHFSYSLYLTHLPFVALCYFALAPLALAPPLLALSMLTTSIVVSLLVAHVFHLLVERHFLKPPAALKRP
jgi:peptidoglycan/LPS O-acetylase OafA/YrhL